MAWAGGVILNVEAAPVLHLSGGEREEKIFTMGPLPPPTSSWTRGTLESRDQPQSWRHVNY